MGFKLGALSGLTVGYVLGTRASAAQRARVNRTVDRITHDPRMRRAKATLGRNVGQVADSLTDQMVGAVDKVGDKVDDVVRPSDAPGGADPGVGRLSAAG